MADRPKFVPIWLRCRCGHNWDDWQPTNVPIAVWVAAIRMFRCPACGERKRIYLRNKPLDAPQSAADADGPRDG